MAISTTGDEHRLGFLETCVREWDRCLPSGASLFVTVDGSVEDTRRVQAAVYEWTESVYRVGQPYYVSLSQNASPRLGVAVNKNTGLELLMHNTQVEHLFLSDDDTWPLYAQSLDKHIDLGLAHSMVMWGHGRLVPPQPHLAYTRWSWPRGVMLYTHRSVVQTVGGMVEAFGPGGHEHVEWSTRIYNAGLTPALFPAPASYATRNAMGAAALWHCEDMRKPRESIGTFMSRKRHLTSVRRADGDWDKIDKIMRDQEGSTAFVPYRASLNGRASATLCQDLTGQGGCAVEPAKPRSET